MATAPLNDFTYYNNRSLGGIDDPNDPRAQANLQAVRQYDPNANYRPTYGSDGQLLGYTLDVDASKLPGTAGTGALGGTSGHGSGADYMPTFSTVQQNMQLGDPNAVTSSPTYGRITQNTNIEQPSSLLDVLGPAAVLGFGALMGGIPALYQGIFGQGAYGAPDFASLSQAAGNSLLERGPLDPSLLSGANQPLGSAESSLYGAGALDSPSTALGGLQDGAPIVDQGTAARVGDVIRNGGTPGLSNIASSLHGIDFGNLTSALNKVPGLGGGATGGAGGGGGGLLQPYQMQPYKSLTAILQNFGLLGGPHG